MTDPTTYKSPPLIDFDPQAFAHHLEGLKLTDEQADELIRALAKIMMSCVDLGFGIGPDKSQCGQRDFVERFLAGERSDVVNSTHQSDSDQPLVQEGAETEAS